MHKKKILLLSPVDVRKNSIGSIFINDIISTNDSFEYKIFTYEGFPYSIFSGKRTKRLFIALINKIKFIKNIRLILFRIFICASISNKIEESLRLEGVESIWVTPGSTPEVMWIACRLARKGYDVRSMIWDAPEYLHLWKFVEKRALGALEELLRLSSKVSVISYAMRDMYKIRYGIDSIIIRHGINPVVRLRDKNDISIRIVFAGSIYCKNEWNSFVNSIEKLNWEINGRNISLFFIGTFPLTGAVRPSKMVDLGHKSIEETLQLMSSMDIGYLPYWFDKNFEIAARTSFPGKMTAYSAAGLTIFHHAPPYTEVSSFLNTYKYGICCTSTDIDRIISDINLAVNLDNDVSSDVYRQLALTDELSYNVMADRFSLFMR